MIGQTSEEAIQEVNKETNMKNSNKMKGQAPRGKRKARVAKGSATANKRAKSTAAPMDNTSTGESSKDVDLEPPRRML